MGPLEIPYSDICTEYEHLQLSVSNLTSQLDAQRAKIEDLEMELTVKQQALEMSDNMLENVSALLSVCAYVRCRRVRRDVTRSRGRVAVF